MLQTDPEERFHLIYRSPTETVVRIKLSDTQREWLHEKWRAKVLHCLQEQQRSMALTELGANVKRPSIHLGNTASLRNVLLEDPQGRFILSGQADAIRVRLSTLNTSGNYQVSAVGEGDNSPYGEWYQVTRKSPSTVPKMHTTSVTTPKTVKPKNKYLKQTTEAELQVLSDRQERWNAKPSGGSQFPPQHSFLNLQPPPSNSSSSSAETVTGFDHLLTSHDSSWGWKSPLEDVIKHTGWMEEADPPQLSLSLSSPQSSPSQPRLSYKEKLAPGLPNMKVICRPTPVAATQQTPQAHHSPPSENHGHGHGHGHLSPTNLASPFASLYASSHVSLHYATDRTTNSSTGNSTTTTSLNTSPTAGLNSTAPAPAPGLVPYIPARPRPNPDAVLVRTRLTEWLPVVLQGFQEDLVRTFVNLLDNEGFMTVRDLVVAKSLGQLSAEYLGELGLKTGHCNRIFAALPGVEVLTL